MKKWERKHNQGFGVPELRERIQASNAREHHCECEEPFCLRIYLGRWLCICGYLIAR